MKWNEMGVKWRLPSDSCLSNIVWCSLQLVWKRDFRFLALVIHAKWKQQQQKKQKKLKVKFYLFFWLIPFILQ